MVGEILAAPRMGVDGGEGRRLRIVVADDDPDDRFLMEEAFAELGQDVQLIFARDGVEAFEALLVDPLAPRDLVITDLSMPRMNGFELLQAVRGQAALEAMPVLVLTTSSAPEDAERAYQYGATSVRTKPHRFPELVALVRNLLEEWGRVRPAANGPPASAQADVPPCFELETELGRGGTSTVYRARWMPAGDMIALKLSHKDLTPALTAAFLSEAKLGLRRRHPGFPRVLASGRFRSRLWMAQEVADGPDLDAFAREPAWTGPRKLETVARVARHIHALHEEGLLHLDIKGANVVLTRNGPVVVDLGLAMPVGGQRAGGRIQCTPYSAPPELITGETLDERADVFQLGVLLYELLGARGPWFGRTGGDVLKAILREPPLGFHPDADRVVGLDDVQRAELATLVGMCIARRPEERPPSAQWLAGALEAIVANGAR